MFKRIGLISSGGKPNIRETVLELTRYLENQGLEYVVHSETANLLNLDEDTALELEDFVQNIDLAIAIGGDGTMLRAAHLLVQYDVPLTGINLGRLGFLADIPADDIDAYLSPILKGEYFADQRFLLHSQVIRHDKCIDEDFAFNDVVIQKKNIAQLIELSTYINDVFVHTQRSDGLIVATPTGSTAYALSGGGPILHPTLDALVLVPICAHNLSNRPIAVKGDSVVAVNCLSPSRLTCDSSEGIELIEGDQILIKKHEKSIHLIHPANHDQYHVLREKLNWSKELC